MSDECKLSDYTVKPGGAFLVYPTTYPITIKMIHACMHRVKDGALQFFLCC